MLFRKCPQTISFLIVFLLLDCLTLNKLCFVLVELQILLCHMADSSSLMLLYLTGEKDPNVIENSEIGGKAYFLLNSQKQELKNKKLKVVQQLFKHMACPINNDISCLLFTFDAQHINLMSQYY